MEEQTIRINYKRAKFGRRLLAHVIDFLIFIFLFFVLFLSSRAIAGVTPTYQQALNHVNEVKLNCGLYTKINDRIISVVTYQEGLDQADSMSIYNVKIAMREFTAYLQENGEPRDAADKMIERISDIALNDENLRNEQGIPYFYRNPETQEIRNNPECEGVALITKFKRFYKPVIMEIMEGYLVSSIPHFHEEMSFMSRILFFVELPVSYLVSGALTWFLPTLIFRKGRKTFGRAIYHIGTVDKRLLNPTFGRSFARFSIFYFAELILCLFTFGIPLIISFSMMAFSKNKQSFPDYMLGLYEVDTSDNKIFDSYDEVTMEDIKHSKSPVDFKMTRDL